MCEQAPYRVVDIAPRTPVIAELRLAPRGDTLAYRAGQYVLLEDDEGAIVPRSYSIANAPRPDGQLSLLITREAGGQASTWVHDRLSAGDEVRISGPYGAFVDDDAATAPALYLAGGSGLAPIRALLQDAIATGRRRALTLVFSARTEADIIDGERFADWQRHEPRFRFVRTLTRAAGPPPSGRVPEHLAALAGPLDDTDVFVAGRSDFVVACGEAAAALGVPRSRIHTEVFYADPAPWSGTAPEATRA